ncbi:unnamed protein product [Periconia digitata]|uniref:Nucleoside phosphorylase domain-containing protein n=1 Tax=Periconia digitata TaxID=1303443 RepID=A0A9W4UG74_9PLEO|nr:unnamed protein product [Periconia digitata]
MATQAPPTERRTHSDYTVGWICALAKEQTAATVMLDDIHPDLAKPPQDDNTYTLGSIGGHNIVIACLPMGKYGTVSAATVATKMIGTFTAVRIGLMVGIGGGVPPNVRLGDIVVSTPVDKFPGVVQWDFGKTEKGGEFRRTGALNNPPAVLLTALTKLKTQHDIRGSKIPQYLGEVEKAAPKLKPKFTRATLLRDPYSEHAKSHGTDTDISEQDSREICIHYGLVASGNQVIKDAELRDRLNDSLDGNLLCVEMEAAGLMDSFPCIAIRGICDYADSQKNKDWQEYAATIAAAFAKELLGYVQPHDVDRERTAKDILGQSHTLSSVGTHTEIMRSKLDKTENTYILDWLTPVDYGPLQSSFIRKRQEGTGMWALEKPEYMTWLQEKGKTLFCPGIPGAGKTILTAIVVDNLYEKHGRNHDTGIAYIYCNFQRQQEQKPEDLLLSLIKQFAQSQSSLPESLRQCYGYHNPKRTRPSMEETEELLHSVLALYSRAFIIVDALDECSASEGGREKLFSVIFRLQARTGANIFATSRLDEDIAKMFQNPLSFHIRASDQDVVRYLNKRISLMRPDSTNEELEGTIREGVSSAVDGMFLLAELHMNMLEDQPTKGDVREALQHLQRGTAGLQNAYEQTMERIERQGEHTRKLAKQILSWIVHAKRQLTTLELRHALAVRPQTTSLNEEYIPSTQLILSVCAGLVAIDANGDRVQLVHYTTQEYFVRTKTAWFPTAERDIADVCVAYLLLDSSNPSTRLSNHESTGENDDCSGSSSVAKWLKIIHETNTLPLYDYAAGYWGRHVQLAMTEGPDIVKLLEDEARVSACSQTFFSIRLGQSWQLNRFRRSKGMKYINSTKIDTRMSGMHLAAYFGLDKTLASLLHNQNDPNSRDIFGHTPLWWAVWNKHDVVVKRLCHADQVDINCKDEMGYTPLLLAVDKGRESIVKMLCSTGRVDLDCKSDSELTPLWLAASCGMQAIVEHFLHTKSVDVHSKSEFGATPLLIALSNGYMSVVETLLSSGVDIASEYEDQHKLLATAAEKGFAQIVERILTKCEIDIEFRDEGGYTMLLMGAKDGRSTVVDLLLTKFAADIGARDHNGQTALHLAAMHEHKGVLDLLLSKHGANVESQDQKGYTPLMLAAMHGHREIVEFLLTKCGADRSARDFAGLNALAYALKAGHDEICEFLLDPKVIEIRSRLPGLLPRKRKRYLGDLGDASSLPLPVDIDAGTYQPQDKREDLASAVAGQWVEPWK